MDRAAWFLLPAPGAGDEAVFRAVQPASRLFFTHAYVSWEKGSVENCNRLVRRWYPKGTDFSRVSVQAIAALEDRINAIHRHSLDGSTALQCFLQESA